MASQRMENVDFLIGKFSCENNVHIKNISTWKFCDSYFVDVLSEICWPKEKHEMNYNYPWEMGLPKKILRKLRVPETHDCIIITNTSQAITLLAHLASCLKADQIVVNPSYWSVEENIKAFGGTPISFHAQSGTIDEVMGASETKVIWLTRPMFATGSEIPKHIKIGLKSISNEGTYFFFDEALMNPFQTALHGDFDKDNSFFVLSPHKHLNVNGAKFSILIFPKRFEKYVVEYSDSLLGSLPSSTITAANHFLSENYDHVVRLFSRWVNRANFEIESLLSLYGDVEIAPWVSGIYRSIYFPKLDYRYFDEQHHFFDLMAATKCAIIPGNYNKSCPTLGLSFRVNLSQHSAEYLHAINKVIKHINSIQ